MWKPLATTQGPDYKDKNRYFELSPHAFTLRSQGGAPGDDQSGQTEDEDAAADNGEAEIVEHHGWRLHQVAHQHGEHLGSQGAADDEGCADLESNNANSRYNPDNNLAGHADLLLRPKESCGEDGGHPDPECGSAQVEDEAGLSSPHWEDGGPDEAEREGAPHDESRPGH